MFGEFLIVERKPVFRNQVMPDGGGLSWDIWRKSDILSLGESRLQDIWRKSYTLCPIIRKPWDI